MSSRRRPVRRHWFYNAAGMFYDAAGQEITIERYGELACDRAYKRLAYDLIGTRGVSTVWLGVNTSLPGDAPLVFETMVFPECELTERYATREQALAGHAEMCRTVSAMQLIELRSARHQMGESSGCRQIRGSEPRDCP